MAGGAFATLPPFRMKWAPMGSEWEQAEIDYWQAAADQIKPDILAEIMKPPPPTRKERFIAWWNKPRGTAAIINAQGEAMANTIRLLQGR